MKKILYIQFRLKYLGIIILSSKIFLQCNGKETGMPLDKGRRTKNSISINPSGSQATNEENNIANIIKKKIQSQSEEKPKFQVGNNIDTEEKQYSVTNNDYSKDIKQGMNLLVYCHKCNRNIVINSGMDSEKYACFKGISKPGIFQIGLLITHIPCKICHQRIHPPKVKSFIISKCKYQIIYVLKKNDEKYSGIAHTYIEYPLWDKRNWSNIIVSLEEIT